MSNFQNHVALQGPQWGAGQVQARFAQWGQQHSADTFLASPGEGKTWGVKAKTNGKVKNALSRAAAEAWGELIEDYPLPEGLLGRLSRASTPFITKVLEDNTPIVKASMNTVFLSYLFIEEFKNYSRADEAPPGKLVTAAAENAFRLLCEGKKWVHIKEAMLCAARVGDWRVDVHYTRLVASHPSARTHAPGGGGALDRLAAAAAASTTASVSPQVPYWQQSPYPAPESLAEGHVEPIEGEIL